MKKDIFNGKYTIYSNGTIVDNYGNKIKPYKGSNNYIMVHLNNKSYFLHTLVAKAFVPNPNNKKQVNHKDGNTENPTATNLEWVTNTENVVHAINNGLTKHSFKQVEQRSLSNVLIAIHDSINEAANKLAKRTNITYAQARNGIIKANSKKENIFLNYFWKIKEWLYDIFNSE